MKVLERKVVLITGCSSGFGLAAALRFARGGKSHFPAKCDLGGKSHFPSQVRLGGWQVFAGVRNLNGAGVEELKEFPAREGLPLEIMRLDVTDDKSVADAVGYVKERARRLDVLINNAGFGFFGPIEDFTVEEILQQYETNVFGMVRMIKAVVPLMRRPALAGQPGGGLIINISSISGLIALPFSGVYASSKYALEALSDALRLELAPFNIKVVLVEPGAFRTAFSRKEKWAAAFRQDLSPYRSLRPRLMGGWDKRFKPRGWLGLVRRFLSPVLKSRPPGEVVEVLWRIANNKNPRARYLVGRDAHFFLWLKKLLPSFLWDATLRKFYGW